MGFGEPKFPGDGVHGPRAQKGDETSEEYLAANPQFATAREEAWKKKMQEAGVDSEDQQPTPEQQQAQKEREEASQMVADHFKGVARISDGILTPEEAQILSQMETLYNEQKAANPDQPVKFGLDDRSNEIYMRLLHRLPLAIKEHGHMQRDEERMDEVREQLGIQATKKESSLLTKYFNEPAEFALEELEKKRAMAMKAHGHEEDVASISATIEEIKKRQEIDFQGASPERQNTLDNLDDKTLKLTAEHSGQTEDKEVENLQKEHDPSDNFEEYIKLPNVKKAYEAILRKLNSKSVSSGDLGNDLYQMLITRSNYIDFVKNKASFGKETSEYKNNLDDLQSRIKKGGTMGFDIKPRLMGGPGWFHIITRPEVSGKTEGLSKKIYATIDLDNSDFVKNIDSLAEKLRKISIDNNDSIQIKFPESLESFAQHNDSIVIHFKKDSCIESINEALKEYLVQNNMKEAEREMGRTKIAADSKDESFSELVTLQVGRWAEQNHGKYSPEVLAKMAIQHAIELSKKPPEVRE
jgi:hypothetical protein